MPVKNPTRAQWKALYAAADEFIAERCWEHVDSDYVFGVRIADGQTYYCGILGFHGKEYGFFAYRNLSSYLCLLAGKAKSDPGEKDSFYLQDGLVMSLNPRNELDAYDRRLSDSLGFKPPIRGKWPLFRSLRPGYHPWSLDRDEAVLLTACLGRAVEISRRTAGKDWSSPDRAGRIAVETAKKGENGLIWRERREKFEPPEDGEDAISVPPMDELKLRRIRTSGFDRDGLWEADYFFSPVPVQDGANERPYYPFCLLIMDGELGTIIGQRMVGHADLPVGLADLFLETILGLGIIPAVVRVKRAGSQAILEPLSHQLAFELKMQKKLHNVEFARRHLEEYMGKK